MSQFAFGSGNGYVTPLQDATGATPADLTTLPLMVLQEGSLDFSSDLKELYGQNQLPVAAGRGKMKIGVKMKPARIFAGVWNNVFFGQPLTSGIFAAYTDTTGAAIPSTPFQVTASPPSAGTFVADLGVIDANGNPMKRVVSAPTTGQYSVNVGTGAYTFAAADTGKVVYINFQYTAASTTAKKQTVMNLPMGYAPTFKLDLTVAYLGKLTSFSFGMCIATKMNIGFKNEDFAIPEFDASVFDPGNGNVFSWATSE